MATIFWDSRSLLLRNRLEKGSTTTGAYYASLLDKFKGAIQAKRPHMPKMLVLFHYDKPAHTS